jgi:type III restriction enzyme
MDSHQAEKVPFEYVPQDRSSYYAQTHFQSVLFLITQKIIHDLQSHTMAKTDRKNAVLRLQSRHQLFPQVFSFVQQFVQRRVNFNGLNPKELGLEKYVTLAVERLRTAILPDDTAGEPPLLPILNHYRPVGSTAGVDFVTTRKTIPSVKSHINAVVLHSGWEGDAATLLDSFDFVKWYARNDHLGLVIRYEYLGVDHSYEPDFVVRLANDFLLLLEIKGYEVHDRERTNAKHEAAKKWVQAVNNLGDFGRWDFLVCRDLDLLAGALAAVLGVPVPATGVTFSGPPGTLFGPSPK